MWRVHALGTLLVCQAAARPMCAAGYGRIVNVVSGPGGYGASTTTAHYQAAKSAQTSFTRSLALALGPTASRSTPSRPGRSPRRSGSGLDGALRDARADRRPRCWRSGRPTPSPARPAADHRGGAPTSCGSSRCPPPARSPARWCRCERAHPPPREHAGVMPLEAPTRWALGVHADVPRLLVHLETEEGVAAWARPTTCRRRRSCWGWPRRRWPASTRWRSASCRRGWRRSAAATTR